MTDNIPSTEPSSTQIYRHYDHNSFTESAVYNTDNPSIFFYNDTPEATEFSGYFNSDDSKIITSLPPNNTPVDLEETTLQSYKMPPTKSTIIEDPFTTTTDDVLPSSIITTFQPLHQSSSIVELEESNVQLNTFTTPTTDVLLEEKSSTTTDTFRSSSSSTTTFHPLPPSSSTLEQEELSVQLYSLTTTSTDILSADKSTTTTEDVISSSIYDEHTSSSSSLPPVLKVFHTTHTLSPEKKNDENYLPSIKVKIFPADLATASFDNAEAALISINEQPVTKNSKTFPPAKMGLRQRYFSQDGLFSFEIPSESINCNKNVRKHSTNAILKHHHVFTFWHSLNFRSSKPEGILRSLNLHFV